MPFVHVFAEGFCLVDALRIRIVRVRQDRVCILLSQLSHLLRLDAVDVDAERDGERGLVLEEGDFVDDGGVELRGGGGGVHGFRIQVSKEFELKAVDGLPKTPVRPGEG